MKTTSFNATARQLIFLLPAIMGVIEYVMRVGFQQPGKDEFFPISLVVAGIGLYVALTTVPAEPPEEESDEDEIEAFVRQELTRRFRQEAFVAKIGVWASVVGVLLWIYLLAASFSDAVKAMLPMHPLVESGVYYVLGAILTEWKARVPEL